MDILRIVFSLTMVAWFIFYLVGLLKFVFTKKSFGKFWAWSSVGFCVLMAVVQGLFGLSESAWHFIPALAWGINLALLITTDSYWKNPA